MAQIPNLDNSPLNLKALRDQSQKELLNILNNIRGKKCLIIDKKLSGSLSLVINLVVEFKNFSRITWTEAEKFAVACRYLYLG